MKSSDLLLYAVTDESRTSGESLITRVEKALEGGATFIQLREKNLGFDEFLSEAKEIQKLCRRFNVPFVINDNVEIAKLIDADGVHVGQSDMEAANARAVLGIGKIVGVSAQTVEQAKKAESDGADYIGVGAVFPTSTKLDASEVSRDTLSEICSAVKIPVIAIGGIGEENISELAGVGICGVAVVSALFSAEDIKGAASRLHKLAAEMVEA